MKSIYITFTDEEIEFLKEIKNDVNWHDFILELAKKQKVPLKKNVRGLK